MGKKTLSLMGICRRAGKLSVGHDVVFDSVRANRARLVIVTSDASDRHKKELEAVSSNASLVTLGCTMDEAALSLGKRSCIFSVDDEGFAEAIYKTICEEGSVDGCKIQDT